MRTEMEGLGKPGWKKEQIPLELYFHIPFCVKKCAYCDFLSAEAKEGTKHLYMKRLMEDVQQFPHKEAYRVTSVFIGGGTPTIIEAEEMEELLRMAKGSFSFVQDAEITIEANPKTVSAGSLRIYKKAGVNRISFGLQSVHDEELARLGRIHTYEDFLESYQMAKDAGFANINVDLMFAFPGQSMASWRQTLETAAGLDIQHISAYSLIVEEGTPFYAAYGEDVRRKERGEEPRYLPGEELEERMYLETLHMLGEYGFKQYEISNFAKEGFACRHNEGYWSGASYAGFGLGAASYVNHRRFVKPKRLEDYLAGDFSEKETEELSRREQMEEFMILGLRRGKGIGRTEFRERFQEKLPMEYELIIEKYVRKGFLEEKGGRIFFTEKGILVSNLVLSEFIEIL